MAENVAVSSRALETAMLEGHPGAVKLIEPLILGRGKPTPNQEAMARAAGCFLPFGDLFLEAVRGSLAMLREEEELGPVPWELLPPDPHGGMYDLAHVGWIAAGIDTPERLDLRVISDTAARILGQQLRIGDLIATPDGDCRGLGGMRMPLGETADRRTFTDLYREVRRRQGSPFIHRGTGGRPRKLGADWKKGADRLLDGSLFWLRRILDGPHGARLLSGPLAPDAPLPARLRLQLTVARWEGGTLAWYADPGEAERARFLVHGSAVAKREGRPERPVDWIKVAWRSPGKHEVSVGFSWETPRPDIPAEAPYTLIPGAK